MWACETSAGVCIWDSGNGVDTQPSAVILSQSGGWTERSRLIDQQFRITPFDEGRRSMGRKSETSKQRNSGSVAYLKNLTMVATQYVR